MSHSSRAVIPDTALAANLATITQPVRYANGMHDVMIHPYASYAAVEHLPSAKLLLYSDAGHAFLVQHLEEFATEVKTFLAQGERPGAQPEPRRHQRRYGPSTGRWAAALRPWRGREVDLSSDTLPHRTTAHPALAFIAAVFAGLGEQERGGAFARALIVRSRHAWQRVASTILPGT